jgi:outer membrane protein assembly factor BamE (lipoprotein component of BamABCDE complex)
MILSIFLNGCVNIGRDFPGSEAVKGIQNGKTTKLEILEAFGTPRRTGIENGDEIWTYDYSKYLLGRTYTKDLIIRFNKEDVVESYSYSNNFPDAR